MFENKPSQFLVGVRVVVKMHARFGEGRWFHPGVVSKIRNNGNFTIKFDKADAQTNYGRYQYRPSREGTEVYGASESSGTAALASGKVLEEMNAWNRLVAVRKRLADVKKLVELLSLSDKATENAVFEMAGLVGRLEGVFGKPVGL